MPDLQNIPRICTHYLFAITMAAQPLAWFEGSNLPKEAFAVSPIIDRYIKVMTDFHSGVILPIGDEPSGKSWTGFQSQKEGETSGFVLIYREMNEEPRCQIQVPMLKAGNYRFELVTGNGRSFKTKAESSSIVRFTLDKPNSFALYRYTKNN